MAVRTLLISRNRGIINAVFNLLSRNYNEKNQFKKRLGKHWNSENAEKNQFKKRLGKHWNSENAKKKVLFDQERRRTENREIYRELENDEGEEDFHKVNRVYDQHQMELKKERALRSYKTTERRHFRPPQETNMLTWATKEHIRHLNSTDPEQWTPEELAKSFPITVTGVKKFLKSNFKKFDPPNEEWIKEHDQKLVEKWKASGIKAGPIYLKLNKGKHISTNNALSSMKDKHLIPDSNSIDVVVKPSGPFTSILKDYKALAEKVVQKDEKTNLEENDLVREDFTISKHMDGNITADQFEQHLKTDLPQLHSVITDNLKTKFKKPILQGDTQSDNKTEDGYWPSKWAKPKPEDDSRKSRRWEFGESQEYPDRIEVEQNEIDNNYVIQRGDAFYDADGEFLYRVPGLTENQS